MIKNYTVILLFFANTGLLIACGGNTRNASPLVENIHEVTQASIDGDFNTLVAQGNAHWEMRYETTELHSAIFAWEQAILVATEPEEERAELLFPVYVSLARGYYLLGDTFVPREDEEAADFHAHGMEFGARAIALGNEDWTQALLYETPISEAVQTLTIDDIPAVYWYAANAGRWAFGTSRAEVLARKEDIYSMIIRVSELDSSFFYGAPHRYFGVYFTKVPFGSPGLEQSRQHFEVVMDLYPDYLDNFFLYASEYCVAADLREEATEALQYVLDYDIESFSELHAENLAAQRKAQNLMEHLDEIF